MAQISMRIDDDLKKQAEALFDELGLTLSSAVTVFVKQSIRQGGIPFEVTTDPLYSKSNIAHLEKSIAEFNAGKVVEKTMEELEAMENA